MKENKWLELDYSENLKEDFKRLINENSNNKIYIKLIDRNRNKIILIEDLSFAGIKKLQITSGFKDFEKIVFKNCVFGNLELIHDTFGNSIFFDDSRSKESTRILLEESSSRNHIRVEKIRKEKEQLKEWNLFEDSSLEYEIRKEQEKFHESKKKDSKEFIADEFKSKLELKIKNENKLNNEDKFLSNVGLLLKNENKLNNEDKFLSIETSVPVLLISDCDFNLKNCIFKSEIKIYLQFLSVNKFEKCKFTRGFELYGDRVDFNYCEFMPPITIKGREQYRGLINIKGGIFHSSIAINRSNVHFINVNFKFAKIFVQKNEYDTNYEFGSKGSQSELLFLNCSHNKIFKLYDLGGNSFKFINSKDKDKIGFIDLSEGSKSLELSNCIIEKFTINGEITDKAIFNNVTFTNPPNIGDIKFKNCNVEFRDIKFIDKKTPEAIAGFRALNKACRDANYHHGEIFFHGLTLEGIGKNLKYKSDFVEKAFSFFYKYFSDFGRSVNRPLCWLVGIFFFFIVINFVGIAINKINNLKISQQSLVNKLTVENNQILTKINDIKDIQTENNEICEEKSRLINYLKSQQQSVINKSIVENNKNCEEQFQIVKINSKIVFKNAVGPLQLALPKDFISDCESKFYNQNSNSIIYFLNFFHAVISSGIWFIWFFMIRARFKL